MVIPDRTSTVICGVPCQPLFVSSLYIPSKAIQRDKDGMFREVEGRFFKELS